MCHHLSQLFFQRFTQLQVGAIYPDNPNMIYCIPLSEINSASLNFDKDVLLLHQSRSHPQSSFGSAKILFRKIRLSLTQMIKPNTYILFSKQENSILRPPFLQVYAAGGDTFFFIFRNLSLSMITPFLPTPRALSHRAVRGLYGSA